MTLSNWMTAFLVVFPYLVILGLVAWRWLASLPERRAHRAWGIKPGREVVRRRGRWHWRTAL